MSLVLRVALGVSLLLLAGGVVVTPHELAAGWSHHDLDHPPGALHSALLHHALHAADRAPAGALESGPSLAAAGLPASVALSTVMLAIVASAVTAAWRPSATAMRAPVRVLADAQRAVAPPAAPPRASFSS